jgi:uncharacterized protein
MPLFDLSPKDDSRALYGRDAELELLVHLVEEGRWAVVLGPRMVGKTSLVKAATHQARRPTIYVNLWGVRGGEGLLRALLDGLNANKPLLKRTRNALRRITGFSIAGTGLTLSPSPRPMGAMADMVRIINEEARRSVIVLDEVQELAPVSGPFLKVLARIFNTQSDVVFLFTGSYFGILRTLLEPTADSPLFGRPPARVQLEPFNRETSVGFLMRGLREYGIPANQEELGSVIDRSLDGIPGWLTLFGNHLAVQRMSLEAAERATLDEGKKVARSELAHFLSSRDRETYWQVLRVLSSGASWTELKRSMASRKGAAVNDNSVGSVLRSLRNAGLIVETGHQYRIRDPMIQTYVREASRAPR